VENKRIRKLIEDGFIKIKTRNCVDCGQEISRSILEWMLDHWVHMTRCVMCGGPIRINISVEHGKAGKACWRLNQELVGATEIHRPAGGGTDVCVAHKKCWDKAIKRFGVE
jgi:hypothetical protein